MTPRTEALHSRSEPSGTITADVSTTKTRRSHRKSRNGCTECKHRHIRCDERKPSCGNCEIAERTCSFLMLQTGKQKRRQGQQYRARLQAQPEVTTTPSSDVETSSQSNIRIVDDADGGHVEPQPPALHQPSTRPDLGRAPGLVSHRTLPARDSLPFLTSFDATSHQIPSPAPPTQLSNAHTPPADCYPGLSIVPDIVPKAIFTPQHMILLHHADTVPNFTAPNRSAVDIAIRHAVDSPYLIDEVLAFTAFHMASLYPGSAMYLQRLATELQTRALVAFTRLTETVPNDDKATAVPRFLFTGILGRHVLADTLTHCRSDFHHFIDRLVDCINLNRGIRAITPRARDSLYNSEIQPFLSVFLAAEKKIISPGNECDPLRRLMDDSDLNEASIKACRQTIELLQWCFDVCHGLNEDDYPQSASAFSVRLEIGFVDLLRKHRPEALVILAYYGVLLYRCRSFWAFSKPGASMIRAIAERLGSYWQEALVWPLYVLETEHNSEPIDSIAET